MSKYNVLVNENPPIEIDTEKATLLNAVSTSKNEYHIIDNNTSYKAEIISSNFNKKTYQISINNNTYTVTIEDDLDSLIKAMGFEIGAIKPVNDIKAPMPGLILEINVAVGQEVEENDNLFILEAMKMENVITSPRHGVIKSISVVKGDAVDKNELLLEFE